MRYLSSSPADLLEIVTLVRRRWRLRNALRGAVVVLAVVLMWLVAGGALLDSMRLSLGVTRAISILGYAGVAFVVFRFWVRPTLRRVTDEQVALYIEEHEPNLHSLLVSAVEQAKSGASRAPAFTDRLVADALEQMRAVEHGRRIERRNLRQATAFATGLSVLAALLLTLGTPATRQGARTLLLPWSEAAAATPYLVLVAPGDATVSRGGDQEITAELRGFTSERVEILFRSGDDPEWQRVAMAPGDSGTTYVFRLFDVAEPTEYVVEADGVRSTMHLLSVADLPAVGNFIVDLRFPAYTGLPSERHDPGGDIVAPRGTSAEFTVTPTLPSAAGRLITEAGDTVSLASNEIGDLAGRFQLERDAMFRFELQASNGAWVEASLRYRIDVVDDRGPTVIIRSPGRDMQATAVEEIFTETEANDDYGLRQLELVVRINGGEEQVIPLHAGGRPVRELVGSHTLFLEEWSLEPGDLITYFARATDNSTVGQTTSSDIYFLRIRPFGKDYRQAEQAGQPGQPGDTPEGLSEQQKQVVAGTFKVQRDRDVAPADRTREDLATLALAQGQLRERVVGLTQQMAQRNAGAVDSGFTIILNELLQAIPEMQAAEEQLGRRRPDEALGPEERALQHLQRAEEAYREVQVAMGGQQQGGGGASSNAEDLADLFELEIDKLRNQYETVQRSQEQRAAEQLDETLERLKQLASRQQQESERLRRAAEGLQSRGQSGSGGGAQQRRMATEAEELARQLERLAREQPSPEATEAARQIRDAAEEMRRSATGQEGSESRAGEAARRLREATRSLESGRSGRLERAVSSAARRAEGLAERQREIGRDEERALQQGAMDRATASNLGERKDSLEAEVERLREDLNRLGLDAGSERPEASRRLAQAEEGLREDRVEDKIRYSKGFLRGGASPEYARNFEESIAANLDSAASRLHAAAEAVSEANANDPSRALDQAGRLVRGLESLSNRLNQRAQGGESAEAQERGNRRGEGEGQQDRGREGEGAEGQAQEGQGQQPGQGQPGQGQQPGGRAQLGANSRDGRPSFVDPGSARQLGRELRERRFGADSLLAEVERLGFDGRDLREIVAELRRLESGELFSDPSGLERLERDVLDRIKAFEFALRRQIAGDESRPVIGPSGEVPPKFRELVEEYYRSLARVNRGPPPPK